MKKFLTLLAAVAFAFTASLAEAATPRAAEDPSAPVASTDVPVPKVRKATHPRTKSATAKKSASKKSAAKKPAGTKQAKKKARLARR